LDITYTKETRIAYKIFVVKPPGKSSIKARWVGRLGYEKFI